MSDRDTVDKDLREYLAKADNLSNSGKLNCLRALFDKHFTFTKQDHVIIRSDLFGIVSCAKANFTNQRLRPNISGKPVESGDMTSLAVIESFISYLNRNELLKKNVAFDYTSEAEEFEGIGDL